MSMMKRFAEDVSVDMGFDGGLNDEVLKEAQRRLDNRDACLLCNEYDCEEHLEMSRDHEGDGGIKRVLKSQ